MHRYIAFLRGINVGGHRVKMDRLAELFGELGFDHVSTFIASGNVLFSTDSEDLRALASAIEEKLASSLGYEVATFLRSPAQLDAIAAVETPGALETHAAPESSVTKEGQPSDWSHYVVLLRGPAPDEVRSSLASVSSEMDQFRFSGAEIHWGIRGKVSESPLFGAGLNKALAGVPSTARNMNTIRRLAAKARVSAEGA